MLAAVRVSVVVFFFFYIFLLMVYNSFTAVFRVVPVVPSELCCSGLLSIAYLYAH